MSESSDFAEVYRGRRSISTTAELAECVLDTLADVRRRRRILGLDSDSPRHLDGKVEQGVTR